jgi:hypothetical protein
VYAQLYRRQFEEVDGHKTAEPELLKKSG